MTALRPFRRLASRLAVLGTVAAILLAGSARPSQAMRHLRLLRASPAADTVLSSSPDAIRLWLSEPTDAAVSKVSLATADGKAVAVGTLTRAAEKDAPLVAPIPSTLAAGGYAVTWKAMSKDGHVVNGTFSFRVRAAE
jgi:copper resistance protein C